MECSVTLRNCLSRIYQPSHRLRKRLSWTGRGKFQKSRAVSLSGRNPNTVSKIASVLASGRSCRHGHSFSSIAYSSQNYSPQFCLIHRASDAFRKLKLHQQYDKNKRLSIKMTCATRLRMRCQKSAQISLTFSLFRFQQNNQYRQYEQNRCPQYDCISGCFLRPVRFPPGSRLYALNEKSYNT